MKQNLLNKLWLRVWILVAIMTTALAGTAWAGQITDYNNIVSGKKYYIGATVSGTDYYFYANGTSLGTGIQGTSKTDKAEASVLVFEGSGDSWSIKFVESGYYLSLASSKANGKVNVVENAANWTASNMSGLIQLKINNYLLQKNSGTSQNFGSYVSGQKNVWLEEVEDASPLASISLSGTYPTTFHVGDTFSHDGMTVTANYDDESTADVTAKAEFTGYDMATAGAQTVTVSYTEGEVTKTATYDITVNAPATLTSISLSGDYQTVFTEGDTFNHDGLVVTANYDDDTTKEVTEDAEFSGYDMSQIGEQTVTVSYQDKMVTYTITVNEYVMPSELVVDFESELSTYKEWEFTNAERGTGTITITAHGGTYYGTTGGKSTASIQSKDKIPNPGTFTCYVSKQSTNTTPSTWYIQVSSDNSNWEDVKQQSATSMSKGDWVEFTADLSSYSDVYVRLYYSGSTAVRNVDDITLEMATPQVLSSIALSGDYPTTFHVGDTFSHDGMTVTANYEGGKTADVTASAEFTGYDMANAGNQTVTVSYTENEETKTATYDITVNAPATLQSISLSGDYPTEFEEGDAFSSEGIVVTAYYDDETESNVTADAEFTGYDMATAGEQTVTVTYGGKTATYDITVVEKKGIATNPYTVAEAIAFIGTLGSATSATEVYVSGIISQVDSYNSKYGSITYWISDNGTTESQMEVYSGLNIGGEQFSAKEDLLVGDIVTVKGYVKMYNTTPEFTQNNQLVSLDRVEKPAAPTFSVAAGTYTVAQSVEFSTTTEGAAIYYTIDGTEPTAESTEYTSAIEVTVTTTIKAIAVKDDVASDVATATYTINTTPSIDLGDNEINAFAEGTDGVIIVTYNNITEVESEVIFCDADGNDTSYDWVTASINSIGNLVYIIDANESTEARTAYMKVYALDDNAEVVYSELITINQAGYIVDYATLPFEWDSLNAPTGITTFNTGTYTGSPRQKFDSTGDYIVLKLNEDPGMLWFDIKGNGLSGTYTFKVQTSTDGETYKDIKTFGQTSIENNTIQTIALSLDADVRYIKWVYVTKVNGNVGLGNIIVDKAETVTVGEAGYATYVTKHNVSFPSDVKAYIATTVNTAKEYVSMTEVTAVPKGTPVVLKNKGTFTLAPVAADATANVEGNELKASDTDFEANGTQYVLAKPENEGVGFYKAEVNSTIAAGKAYLQIANSSDVKGFTFKFDDDPTSINEVNGQCSMVNGQSIYNLAGQRVSKMQRGINIVNGKKILR